MTIGSVVTNLFHDRCPIRSTITDDVDVYDTRCDRVSYEFYDLLTHSRHNGEGEHNTATIPLTHP